MRTSLEQHLGSRQVGRVVYGAIIGLALVVALEAHPPATRVVIGPLIGAAVVVLVENVLSSYVDRWPTILGLIFILVILFARAGIAGSARKLINRWRRRRAAPDTDEGDAPPGRTVPEYATTNE